MKQGIEINAAYWQKYGWSLRVMTLYVIGSHRASPVMAQQMIPMTAPVSNSYCLVRGSRKRKDREGRWEKIRSVVCRNMMHSPSDKAAWMTV